jgi:hypothetical protein
VSTVYQKAVVLSGNADNRGDPRGQQRYIRTGPPSETLSRRALQRRAAAVFMMLILTRPVGMLRMEVGRERWSAEGSIVEVPTKVKAGKGTSKLPLIRRKRQDDANLCPCTLYCLLKQEAEKRGVHDSLWYSEEGVLFASSGTTSGLLREVLEKAGISKELTAYSFRHALITYLFDTELMETEVSTLFPSG